MLGRFASRVRAQSLCEVGALVAGYLVHGGLMEVAQRWPTMQERGKETEVYCMVLLNYLQWTLLQLAYLTRGEWLIWDFKNRA